MDNEVRPNVEPAAHIGTTCLFTSYIAISSVSQLPHIYINIMHYEGPQRHILVCEQIMKNVKSQEKDFLRDEAAHQAFFS